MPSEPKIRFSRQVAITFAARVSMVAASMLTGLIIARRLGAEGVGLYAVLTLTSGMLVQIVGSGLASANVFFAAKEPDVVPRISVNSAVFALIAGSAAISVVLLAYTSDPTLFPGISSNLLLIALAVVPFQLAILLALNLLLALGAVRQFNLLDAGSQSLVLVNAVVILIVLGGGLFVLVSANTAAFVISTLVIVGIVFRRVRRFSAAPNPSFDIRLLGRMLRFAIKINVMNAALAIVLRADVFLLNYFRGEAEAGVYSIATQFSLLLLMFPNVVGTMLFPNVAGMNENAAEFSTRVIRSITVLQLALCALAIPLAFAIPLIYGLPFAAATWQLIILVPGALVLGIQTVLSQHLVGIGRIRVMPAFWILTLIVNITLNIVVIPMYGGLGAAAVSAFSYMLIFILTLGYFIKNSSASIADILVFRPNEFKGLFDRSHE